MAKSKLGRLSRRELLELLIAQRTHAMGAASMDVAAQDAVHSAAIPSTHKNRPLPLRDFEHISEAQSPLNASAARGVETPAAHAAVQRGAASASDAGRSGLSHPAPSLEELYAELDREQARNRFIRALRSTLAVLVTVAAAAVLVATLVTPVLQITGTSMTPTLHDGQLVVSLKGSSFAQGDIIAFYYNNKILVKRVIAGPGDWVDIDSYGNVSVNDQPLDEPYLTDKALGECDIELPYQVPDGRWFVMGDHRATSVDSRSSAIGCVAEEQIVGTIAFRIWPITEFGPIHEAGTYDE